MLRFRFILLAAALAVAAPALVNAQTSGAEASAAAVTSKSSEKATAVPFRSGTILSAEISSQKPSFDVESEFDKPSIENPAWVELIVKLDNGRSISRFDYELVSRNGTYPCFAVAEGSDGYSVDVEKWIVKSPHPLKYYRLLFPVRQEELSAAKGELLQVWLKLKLFDTVLPTSEIYLRVMPAGSKFTGVAIPSEGICNVPYSELRDSLKK